MKVTVETLAPCRKRLRIQVPPERIVQATEAVLQDFAQSARVPGFRPGKAPAALVGTRYREQIDEEVRRDLINRGYREAMQEQKLSIVGAPEVDEVEYEPGKRLEFSATVDLAPDFKLPNYKELSVKAGDLEVKPEEVERLLEEVRQQRAHFHDVEGRPLAMGDFALVSYEATIEGKPLAEVEPDAQSLAHNPRFWLWMKPDAFLPEFAAQCVGMEVGGKRTVSVQFPEKFMFPSLVGKKAEYAVELVSIREQHLPELDDAFAQSVAQTDLAGLRTRVEENLKQSKEMDASRVQKIDLAQQLLGQVTCDLPPGLVQRETRAIVQDIVLENQSRGIDVATIEEKKSEIYANATKAAQEAIRLQFITRAIAEVEKIQVNNEDLAIRIQNIAQQRNQSFDKTVEELRRQDALEPLHDRVLAQKVLDFVLTQAKVESAPASAA